MQNGSETPFRLDTFRFVVEGHPNATWTVRRSMTGVDHPSCQLPLQEVVSHSSAWFPYRKRNEVTAQHFSSAIYYSHVKRLITVGPTDGYLHFP